MRHVQLTVVTALAGAIACLGIVVLGARAKPAARPPDAVRADAGAGAGAKAAHASVAPVASPPASELACDQPAIDVGETSLRQQVHEFELTNASETELQITATKKSCGCVKREIGKYELAPGESTKLTLDFPVRTKEGVIADFTERLELYVNGRGDQPAQVLSVSGTFVPVAYRVGDGIHVELPPGEAEFHGSIEVRVNTSRGFRITGFRSSPALPLEARLGPGEPLPSGEEERFTVEVSGRIPSATRLPASGTVIAQLNSDEMPELPIPVVVYRPRGNQVEISPERLAFGVLEPGATAARCIVVVFPDESDYAVETAHASGDAFRVRVEERRAAKHTALVRCEFEAGKLRGAVNENLVISMAAAGKPPETYTVPISAYVKPPAAETADAVRAEPLSN